MWLQVAGKPSQYTHTHKNINVQYYTRIIVFLVCMWLVNGVGWVAVDAVSLSNVVTLLAENESDNRQLQLGQCQLITIISSKPGILIA